MYLAQETPLNRIENYITYDYNGNLSDEHYYYEEDFFYETNIKFRHTPLFIHINFFPVSQDLLYVENLQVISATQYLQPTVSIAN